MAQDAVRAASAPEVNARVDRATEQRIAALAGTGQAEIAARIAQLDQEWDVERALKLLSAAVLTLGFVLTLLRGKRWLLLVLLEIFNLGMHALTGWCPPTAVMRRLGVRTPHEIAREKYLLMMVRGDFAGVAARADGDGQLPPAGGW